MNPKFFEQPILNSPYEAPSRHWVEGYRVELPEDHLVGALADDPLVAGDRRVSEWLEMHREALHDNWMDKGARGKVPRSDRWAGLTR